MTALVLLIGFLGSGKTTFLRRTLPALRAAGLDPHVVINDYENARIDAALLDGLAQSIRPITGSCVCCGSRDELIDTLGAFEHAPRRVLLVEANGTSDAEELIELLSFEPSLDAFTMPSQVSIVDARRWQKRFWHNRLELEQARTASFLHLSRTDEVDAARIRYVESSLASHGIVATRVSPESFGSRLAEIARAAAADSRRSHAAASPHTCAGGCDHAAETGRGGAHAEAPPCRNQFASFQIELPGSVSRRALEGFLCGLPRSVIRAKGLVRLDDAPGEYFAFQKIENHESFDLFPIGTSSHLRAPVAVFIGPHVPEDAIRAAAALLANALK